MKCAPVDMERPEIETYCIIELNTFSSCLKQDHHPPLLELLVTSSCAAVLAIR